MHSVKVSPAQLPSFSTAMPYCYQCKDRFFISDIALEQHTQNHPNHRQCPKCNIQFVSVKNYSKHIARHHGGNPWCGLCDRQFPHESALGQHYRDSPVHRPNYRPPSLASSVSLQKSSLRASPETFLHSEEGVRCNDANHSAPSKPSVHGMTSTVLAERNGSRHSSIPSIPSDSRQGKPVHISTSSSAERNNASPHPAAGILDGSSDVKSIGMSNCPVQEDQSSLMNQIDTLLSTYLEQSQSYSSRSCSPQSQVVTGRDSVGGDVLPSPPQSYRSARTSDRTSRHARDTVASSLSRDESPNAGSIVTNIGYLASEARSRPHSLDSNASNSMTGGRAEASGNAFSSNELRDWRHGVDQWVNRVGGTPEAESPLGPNLGGEDLSPELEDFLKDTHTPLSATRSPDRTRNASLRQLGATLRSHPREDDLESLRILTTAAQPVAPAPAPPILPRRSQVRGSIGSCSQIQQLVLSPVMEYNEPQSHSRSLSPFLPSLNDPSPIEKLPDMPRYEDMCLAVSPVSDSVRRTRSNTTSSAPSLFQGNGLHRRAVTSHMIDAGDIIETIGSSISRARDTGVAGLALGTETRSPFCDIEETDSQAVYYHETPLGKTMTVVVDSQIDPEGANALMHTPTSSLADPLVMSAFQESDEYIALADICLNDLSPDIISADTSPTEDAHVHDAPPSQWRCRQCGLDDPVRPTATFCGHIFCHDCLITSILANPQCPVCRRPTPLYMTFELQLFTGV